MIYILYLVVAALVTFMSIKASEYVDMLDKTTSLSGAFLGGILLSAVTSLPELFTSISSTLMLDQPGLCIGNILGSNIFNYAMLSFFILTAVAKFVLLSTVTVCPAAEMPMQSARHTIMQAITDKNFFIFLYARRVRLFRRRCGRWRLHRVIIC